MTVSFVPARESAFADVHPSPPLGWHRVVVVSDMHEPARVRGDWPEAAAALMLPDLHAIDQLVRDLLANPQVRVLVWDGDVSDDNLLWHAVRDLFRKPWQGRPDTRHVGHDLLPQVPELALTVSLLEVHEMRGHEGDVMIEICRTSYLDRPGTRRCSPPDDPRPRIYGASHSRRGSLWRQLRNERNTRIISTWIDESGPGQTSDWADLWDRNLHEASTADRVVVLADPGLRGALLEVGAALSHGVPVLVVPTADTDPCAAGDWVTHPLVSARPWSYAPLLERLADACTCDLPGPAARATVPAPVSPTTADPAERDDRPRTAADYRDTMARPDRRRLRGCCGEQQAAALEDGRAQLPDGGDRARVLRWVDLRVADVRRRELDNSLCSVGSDKPLGGLGFPTPDRAAWAILQARVRGLRALGIFGGEPGPASCWVYAWHPAALRRHLMGARTIPGCEEFPADPRAFVMYVRQHVARPGTPPYAFIAAAYGDRLNPGLPCVVPGVDRRELLAAYEARTGTPDPAAIYFDLPPGFAGEVPHA